MRVEHLRGRHLHRALPALKVSSLMRRVMAWLAPQVPEALRADLARRQLMSIQQHVPTIYLMASLNVFIVMAVCAQTGIEPRYYLWMTSLVVLALVRTVVWSRTARAKLTPEQVSVALRRSGQVAFFSMLVMGAFTCVTFATGVFHGSTLIPISLAFGSMSIAHCFAVLRPTAVSALLLGIAPTAVTLLLFGDFNAQVLGVSMLSVSLLMTRFVAVQFDQLVVELKLHREVHDLANTDGLTHLLNRRALVTLVDSELARGASFGLALLDLDGFKGVNDRLGHLIGDELLKVVAKRLVAASGDAGTAARLGGDEFVVVFHDVTTADDLAQRVKALRSHLCQPTGLSTETVEVRASLGAAWAPREGSTTAALLGAADQALYENKRERTRTGERRAPVADESPDRRRHRTS